MRCYCMCGIQMKEREKKKNLLRNSLFDDEAHAVNKRPEGRNGFFRSLNETSSRARVYGFQGNILLL